MSDNDLFEDDIWEYKSLRKSKQADEPVEIKASQKRGKKPKRETTRKPGPLLNTKKNTVTNANASCPGILKNINEPVERNGHALQSITTTPPKKYSENKKESPKTPVTRAEGHCPSCQMPFSILLVQTPRWHVSECLDTSWSTEKECPDSILCTSTIPSHYKRFTHYQLARSRAMDDSVCALSYTPCQTISEEARASISANVKFNVEVKEKTTNNVINRLKNVSPKSKSPSSSQESVKWTSLDAWLSSPSKHDKNSGTQSQEQTSNGFTGHLDVSKTTALPQQDPDLNDSDICYSPLVSDEELNSNDHLKRSIKRLFSSESSEDNCQEETGDISCTNQQGKDLICQNNTGNDIIKIAKQDTKNFINKDSADTFPQEGAACQISAGAANLPECADNTEDFNWSECSSPASVVNEWDTNELWFPVDTDEKAIVSSAPARKETNTCFYGNYLAEENNCVNSKGQCSPSSSQRHLLTENIKSFHTLGCEVVEKKKLPITNTPLDMPSKTQPASSKGMKQMDIGVFFGLKPKAKVEVTEEKSSLKMEKKMMIVPADSVSKPSQRKRKTRGSVGDAEALADNTNIVPTAAAVGGQQRWGKRFKQGSTGGEGKGKKQCPFYKKIPGTGFTVDAFQYGEIEDCSAYFLTHFHSDHYGGLTKKFRFPIYCSKITGNLVQSKLRVEPQYINTLPMNTECVVNNIGVVLLEANHCPGAVLLLFCLPNGTTILHTGDFRADPSMENYPALIGQKIHTLYLDTTYCSPEYTFPPQQEAIQFAVNTAFEMVTIYPRTMIVCGTYSVGKEKVFLGNE
ncbi:DNA cross-link repair 1A protein [Bombina bombina]|uniref:DNA cross-link repair 1A protein n=1 Tax=Bombina bombina TaxID=8345 RepID=UPI00235B1266|nr:DNA cross-link repair 1A protein [Bombina bombina]